MYLRDPRAADTDADTDFSLLLSVASISALSLRCKVGQVCEEVMRVPLVNMAWEQALAMWGQYGMSADEHRRRTLTRTFHSSSVRADVAASKFLAAQVGRLRQAGFQGWAFFFFPSYLLTSSLLPGFLLDHAAQRRGGGGIQGGGVSAAVLHLAHHR